MTYPVIQSLWVGEKLSVMEILSISSFLQKGHPFHLYVYDDVKGVPDGVNIECDATSPLTTCNRTLADCVERNNSERFGGFLGMQSDGIRIA